MKKSIILIIIFLSYNSCNNLDLLPLDRLAATEYYKTAADFDGAIFASYSSIQDLWGTSTETLGEQGEYWKISVTISDDVMTDINNADGVSQSLDNLIIRASDIPFAAAYTQIYEGILRANIVLENIDGENELTDEEKTRIEGEAKFLRAFFHFEAMKLWGTPPLVTSVLKDLDNLAVPNATKDALFTQIISDFHDAYLSLPDNQEWGDANLGRATKWAARAYEGKVNVWKEDWSSAITAFEDVITNGPYQLIDTDNPAQDLEDLFAFDNENNSESIFEVQFGGPYSDDNVWVFDDTHSEAFKASQGIGRGMYWDAANGAPGGKNGWWAPTEEFVAAFEPGDARLNAFVYQANDDYYTTGSDGPVPYDPTWSPSGYTVKKYSGVRNIATANHAGHGYADYNNERMFRFAELKLLYAETLLEEGRDADAEQQINDIRDRAGLPDLPPASDLRLAMMKEKRMELAFEPHRWFDITRWGIGPTVFGASWDPKYEVFPFPLTEIDRTGGILDQNLGY